MCKGERDWKEYYEQLLPEDQPVNPLPNWEPLPEFLAPLPLHVMSIATHACVFCGEGPIWSSYEEYREHFYAYEWEGERYHAPSDPEKYYLVASLCTAVRDS
ncbi:hypothetical protein SEA_XITLALLI_27 [Microbacterium phage Xitlalli]|nr:hypothetical protein SEA_XITLALLI_27 [Microbacterium phage Xitlalli]